MEYKWLSQKNNNKLIIFFNGWGMDEFPVKHLASDDYRRSENAFIKPSKLKSL